MKHSKNFLVLLIVMGLLVSANLFATNGYFSHGYGTHYKGMAGAGTALGLSSMAASTNPAGMAFVGSQIDIGAALFNPNREYTVTGNPSGYPNTFPLMPANITSGSVSFIVPSAGVTLALPGGHHLGLSLYGNGGMNTDYESPVFGMQPTGVNLSQLFVAATYARQIISNHAIGVTGIFAYQMFEAKGLGAFGQMGFSSDAANLSDNDVSNSTGFGARIGYIGKIMPMLSIGASYQTKMAMSEFEEYAGLFAEQGGFDIPATWSAGIALHATPLLTIALDIQQIMYSDIKSIANPMLPNLMQAQLGNDEGAGFGWEDMTVYKLGVQWNVIPGLTLRGGYSMGEQPIPESEVMFNILAPGVIENHATFGFSKTLLPTLQVHAALTRAFSNSVTGENPMEAPGQQEIELKMDQWDAELGISFSL